jgi:DNA-binding transcriptional ArsR family regulator
MMDGYRTMTPPPEIDPDFRPVPVLHVADTDTLKAISDPTRMRLLEVMVTRQDPAWSVKELAAVLGVPQTRLYHHIELLTERSLIRAVEQRVVSGIIETRYRVAAKSFQLDRKLFAGDTDGAREVLAGMLETVFDRARE